MIKKVRKLINLKPYGLNADNAGDFNFLVSNDAIEGMKNGDGTTGFVVKNDMYFVGALCGRFESPKEYRITSIFVSPDMRRRGVGTFMMETLYDILPEKYVNILIDVQKNTTDGSDLCAFMDKMGFTEVYSKDNALYVTSFQALEMLKLPPSNKADVRLFSMIPQHVFYNFMPEEGEYAPLPEGGFFDDEINRDLSIGILNEGELVAYAIVKEYDRRSLALICLYVKESESNTLLMTLVSVLKNEALKKYDLDTELFIPTANERMAEFVEKIIPKKELSQGSILFKKELHNAKEPDLMDMSLSDFLEEEEVELNDYYLFKEKTV